MVLDALRYFEMTDFVEIDRMTFREYRLRMKAYNLRQLDEEYMISYSAWQNREINALKKKGKKKEAMYKTFKEFFNHSEKELELLYGIKKKKNKAMSRMTEYMRKKNSGQL